MNIQGLSSQLSSISRGTFQPSTQFSQSSQGLSPGRGYSSTDSFEGASTRRGPDLGTALRNSLAQAGVDPRMGTSVMDAVRGGTSLDSALKNAGVSPEQHKSVMTAVRAQDPANGPGGDQANFGKVLQSALAQAEVDPRMGKSVMDAVRGGTSLDSALKDAGVSPEQHKSVMTAVWEQDPAHRASASAAS